MGNTWLFVVSRMEGEHELWSVTTALMFLIIIVIIGCVMMFGMNTLFNIKKIKEDWPNQRCSPLIMPFASFFGENTKQNFEFCMGNVFQLHSLPFMGSIGSLFSQFTGLLTSIFDSINSLRNVVASLGGGINVVFQEFTDRIKTFFFKLRMSAIHIKALFGRMYALLFSVMYMGMSGITGMTSFTNTFLFSFLDTFCFPGETELFVRKGSNIKRVPIKDIKIGDILVPDDSRVTATFRFYSRGQPMVKLGPITVSTNHYVMHEGNAIKAGDHPYAIPAGPWDSDELLYCLNTSTHTIPVQYLTFLDYDETSKGDKETMQFVEERVNAVVQAPPHRQVNAAVLAPSHRQVNAAVLAPSHKPNKPNKPQNTPTNTFTEYGFGLGENVNIKTVHGLVEAKNIQIGDKLTTGSEVVGIIRKECNEICELSDETQVTPSTLYWCPINMKWIRYGQSTPCIKKKVECISFVVVPNSQIELEDGTRVRDYMELCSPDAELYYSKHIETP